MSNEIEGAIGILQKSNIQLKEYIDDMKTDILKGYEALEACIAEYEAVNLAIQALQEKFDREIKQQYLDGCMQLNQRCPDYLELQKYREAEKDGRLVVLPHDVDLRKWYEGNLCFIIDGGDVTECIILVAAFDCRKQIYLDLMDVEKDRYFKHLNQIGKTVFLTREEAEAALTGKEGPE